MSAGAVLWARLPAQGLAGTQGHGMYAPHYRWPRPGCHHISDMLRFSLLRQQCASWNDSDPRTARQQQTLRTLGKSVHKFVTSCVTLALSNAAATPEQLGFELPKAGEEIGVLEVNAKTLEDLDRFDANAVQLVKTALATAHANISKPQPAVLIHVLGKEPLLQHRVIKPQQLLHYGPDVGAKMLATFEETKPRWKAGERKRWSYLIAVHLADDFFSRDTVFSFLHGS
jgi:hypothetical protein